MIPMGKIRAVALLSGASIGLMVGHSLTYLQLAPSHGVRTALLGITGHSYLDKILAFGPALALVSALYWMAAGALKSRYRRPSLAGTARSSGADSNPGVRRPGGARAPAERRPPPRPRFGAAAGHPPAAHRRRPRSAAGHRPAQRRDASSVPFSAARRHGGLLRPGPWSAASRSSAPSPTAACDHEDLPPSRAEAVSAASSRSHPTRRENQ